MKVLRTILVAWFLLVCLEGAGQKSRIEQQNEDIRRARQRLAEIDKLRKTNSAEITASERDLTLARNRISAQREIVAGLEGQIKQLSAKIDADSVRVGALERNLTVLKNEYVASIYSTWKSQKLNTVATFLLASQDFNDATRRMTYIRLYNRERARKGLEIDSMTRSLVAEMDTLAAEREGLSMLRSESRAEIVLLREDENEYTEALNTLKKDRKRLEANAKAERAKIAAAQRQIDRIMAEQAAAQKKKGALTEAETALSGRFEDNKGRLPWPVGGPGTVLNHYGTQKMGDGIVFDFTGIFVAATAGAGINAVFDGVVSGVYGVGQFDKLVIVRSGNYRVIYGNLAATPLKTGDKVAVGQRVGTLSTSGKDHKLMFQIWNGTTPLNPEHWLRK
jgi:septal ring factor EnvC (AmiA/AmiB activator)